MTTEPTNFKELFRRAIARVNELKAQLAERDAARDEPIAVIGMACRLPGGADTPAAFWQALLNGVDTVARIPTNRWLAEALQFDYPEAKWASLLSSIEEFDAAFFGISPREATQLDPQQRLLLEVAWEALENAGIPIERVGGTKAGVFVGMWGNDYQALMRDQGKAGVYAGTGCLHSTASGRLSYTLGLQGPCISLDTACSSSLVAVHLASQSLRLKDSDIALAGGVNVILDPMAMKAAAEMQAISPDGHCKSFDASANGYVRGEGCGLVVLKRLADAQRDGDPILAVLLSSAVNQDGRSTGLTVPNVLAQQSLIREALQRAGLSPSEIGYIETHGTGTSLGDPIEFEALRGVFGEPRQNQSACVLGAVKTNVGHTETAAGVTGLIKTVLCLQHEQIPRNIHFETLNPRISLEGTPFVIPTENTKWPKGEQLRRAGVSAFGIGGTNAHTILQEAPRTDVEQNLTEQDQSYVVTLSAKSPAALTALADSYANALTESSLALSDIAYTSSCRRSHLEQRLAVTAKSAREVSEALSEFAAGRMTPRVLHSKAELPAPQVVLVFSGQGAQWIGMGQELLGQSKRFRDAVTECDQLIQQAGGCSVLAELARPEGESLLHRTEVTQPSLFAMQVGILAELAAYGVQPALVIGHSVGEVAAAYAAGLLSLETACRVVVARARGMKDQAGRGKMFSVELTEAEALAALGEERRVVSIAAINGPRSVVLAGEPMALQAVVKRLEQSGTVAREVRVDYAFHSPQMDEAEQQFLRSIGPLAASQGAVRMISTVTGRELRAADCTTAYWGKNIRQPVRFAQAITEAARVSGRVFVEVGPHPVLSAEIAEQLASVGYKAKGRIVATLRRNQSERGQLLGAMAALHVQGVAVKWAAQFVASQRVVPLPNYPWQRERYFVDAPKPKTQAKQPGVASQYYDAVTKLVESVQEDSESNDKHNLYLTFAPFAEIVPGFSWMKIFARPQDHLDQVKLVQEKQVEMRQALFRHVDFSACGRALDFGCGFSTDILHLAKQHPQLTLDGYTISPEQAEVGRQRIKGQGLQDRVQVYCRDSAQEPFPGRYDLVFGFEVAHHIKDKSALFANIGEHLAPGGTLVLADFISNVAFEIEHDASSSFFLMVEQWTELLSAHGLKVQDVLDISRQISNFLHDPAFDEHLEQMRRAGEDENVLVSFQSYDRLGKMLDRGLASYILLSATKVTDAPLESLRSHNRQALTRLIPYESSSSQSSNELSLLYGVDFRPTARRALTRSAASSWLLVSSHPETTAPLAALLRQRGEPCIEVHVGEQSVQVGPTQYQVDQSSALAYQQIFQHAFEPSQPCSHVVFLGALEVSESTLASPDQLGDELTAVCHRAVCLTQALVHHGFSRTPRLFLVTQGAQTPSSRDVVHPEQSVLWGLGKTIALEHPALRCTRIDVDPTVPLSSDSLSLTLLDELSHSDREDQILLRGTNRLAARLVRVPLSPDVASKESGPLRRDRSYLITGGLGGLGLSLARWLCEQGAGSIILVGRNPPQPQQQASLEELAQSGFQVTTVQVDVCDVPSVKKLFTDLARSGLPLAGVFHLAGVLQDQTLLDLSEPTLRTVLLPKVQGAWNLHRLAPPSLDYFVLYSSAAALCGSLGQASYSAANSFLDALAQHRQSLGLPALSIQWGAFSGVGMAAHQGLGQRIAERGIESLSPDDGHRMLRSLLGRSLAVVGVLRLHARQWIESIPSAAALPFYSDLAKQSAHSTQLALGAQKLLIQLRQTPAEDRLPILLAFLQQQIGSVLLMEPERITAKTPFAGLGLDSLLSLEIRNRLEVSLGIRLQATALFTYPHVAALAQYVLERLDLAGPTGTPTHMPASRAQTDVPRTKDGRKLEQLSDEELAQMADELLS